MAGSVGALVDEEGTLLATVLDQTHDCIKLLDLDGVVRYVNRQGALAMELASPAELIGQSYLARWPEEVRPSLQAALGDAGRGKPARLQASRPQPDGTPSWWDVAVSPIRSSSGAITHVMTIARDMTSEVLERQRVEAISLEMRHRLKNALTVAGGIVVLSARGRPDVRAFADEVVSRLNQLGKIEALILDAGSDKRLAQIVGKLAEAYGENSSLTFGELPDIQLGDQSMQALALCFGELVTNSLKYGALRDGRPVHIDGALRGGVLELSWREETQFGEERPGGQGLGLIERLIRTAGGALMREIGADHFRAVMTLPTR